MVNLSKVNQYAIAIVLIAIAYRVIRSTDLELSIANNKLQTSNQIYKTQQLLNDLETATGELKTQQEQYQELKNKYDEVLNSAEGRRADGLRALEPAIKKIEQPEQNLEKIADKISESKKELDEIIDP